MGLFHFVQTTTRIFPDKKTKTPTETQPLLDIDKTDTKKISCPKWTIYNGR